MGFGTLFVGYLLILNMVRPAASDAFAGFIILLALLKLSQFNVHFLRAKWASVAFAVLGVIELPLFCLGMISPEVHAFYSDVNPYILLVRFALLAVLTYFILMGIEDIAREVELEDVPRRAKFLAYANIAVRALFAICSLPVEIPAFLYIYAVAIFLEFIFTLTVLFLLWRCYMMICMPEDISGKRQKPSRFAFVNAYRARQEEKEREMQEYRLEQMKKKSQKKGKKKKK